MRLLPLRKCLRALLAGIVTLAVLANVATAQVAPPAPPGYQPFHVRHAPVQDVAVELRRVLQNSAQILVDPQNNRVLLQGDDRANRIAADVVRSMDRPAAGPTNPASATPMATPIVQSYSMDAGQLQEVANQIRQRYGDTVRLSIDGRTGRLQVLAPANIHQEIKAMVGRQPALRTNFAQPRQSDPVLRRTFSLRQISWRELEGRLSSIWPTQMSMQTSHNGDMSTIGVALPGARALAYVDRRNNEVTIEGPQEHVTGWDRAIRALDDARSARSGQTQLVSLNQTDPDKIQKAVSLMQRLSDDPASGRSSAVDPLGQRLPQSGGARLVARLFQETNDADADADSDAGDDDPSPSDIERAFDPRTGEFTDSNAANGGLFGSVRLEFLEGLDLIIIRGHPDDVKRVTEIIRQITDEARGTQPDVEVYQLRHISSEAVATLIADLYEQVYAPRQGPVTVTPLVKPNALLLVGREENLKSVIHLIKKVDQPVPPSTMLEVFQLRYMSAMDAAQRLTDFYQLEAQTTGDAETGPPGLTPRIRVVPDYRSNALIIQASPRDMAEAVHFVRGIDVDKNATFHEVRIFALSNAIATELAPVLQDAINGQLEGHAQSVTAQGVATPGAATGTARQPSTRLQMSTIDGKKIESGILFDVKVVAETASNALIVTGPSDSMELIGALITQLDQLPGAEAQIKVFTIVNSDATNLAIMLQQLFGQQVTAGTGGFGQAATIRAAFPSATAGESSLVPLQIAVDQRTNSVVASGSAGDLNVIEAIITRLDEDGIETRRTTVYRLQNAPAVDVANAITTVLQQQSQLALSSQTGIISPAEQFQSEVFIVPEAVSNSLIISSTPRFYDDIVQVVKDLDQRPPMVMIQVVIAEVRFDDTFEFGVQLGMQDSLIFDRGLSNVRFPFNQEAFGNDNTAASLGTRENVAGQALSNLGLGRINQLLGYGGLVLTAGNESVNVLIRALQDKQKVRVLSRPQIMTLDNQVGFIQVGADVARVTGSSITQQGNSVQDVGEASVGIILRVQPRISPDGVVVMLLETERSALGAESEGTVIAIDANGNPIRSPQILKTTASTTLSARSGQTVVFSGLATKNNADARRGIPWLSDIPGLGALFRTDTKVEERTELLILMTPYIVKDDEDYEWINRVETDRMSWCLSDVLDMHGSIGTGEFADYFGDSSTETVYPAIDPSGTAAQPAPAIRPSSPNRPVSGRRNDFVRPDQSSMYSPRGVPDRSGPQTQFARVSYGDSTDRYPPRNSSYAPPNSHSGELPAHYEQPQHPEFGPATVPQPTRLPFAN